MTLHYLKPYKQLPLLILPLVKPSWAANRMLKHRKPRFSQWKTEVRSRAGWNLRLPCNLQVHLWCSKNSSNRWMGSNLALFGPSYEDKWLPIPACSHHLAQKTCKSHVFFSKSDTFEARLSSFTTLFPTENGGTVESRVCGTTSLGPPNPSHVLKKQS